MANGIRTGEPRGLNEGRSSKFRVGFRVRQTPEEAIKKKTIVRNDKNQKIQFSISHLFSLNLNVKQFYLTYR